MAEASAPDRNRPAPEPSRAAVLSAYADGVTAVTAAAAALRDWTAPTPCTGWTARDLAGHLLAIARYYHWLLDAAEARRPRTGLPLGAELAAMNARDLAVLRERGGPERVARFAEAAPAYQNRIAGLDWELVLGEWYGVGPLTVGQHTGLAAIEWHVHAWDLARSASGDHRPADPDSLAAARRALPGPRPDGDRWLTVLAWSGRDIT